MTRPLRTSFFPGAGSRNERLLGGICRVLAALALLATFVHPVTGREMRFEQAPPDDFVQLLHRLR